MSSTILGLSSILFIIGLMAVVLRRQLLAMLLGLELMISAVNISLVYFAAQFGDAEGFSAVLLVVAIAAAEAVVGLSLILKVSELGEPAETQVLQELRG